jgi:hypothetical protein
MTFLEKENLTVKAGFSFSRGDFTAGFLLNPS